MAKNKLPVSNKPIPVKIVSDAPSSPMVEKSKEYDRWKVEDALRTLQQAEKCRQDKTLMKHVKSLAKEQAAALSKIK